MDILKNFFIWLFVSIVLIFILQNINFNNNYSKDKIEYSRFIYDLNNNRIKEVYINGREILVTKKNNNNYITYIPFYDSELLKNLLKKNIKIIGEPIEKNNLLTSIFISWSPILILIIIWIFFIKQIQLNNKNAINFSKNRAKIIFNKVDINFSDVAGCDEVKNEISDIIFFLKNPEKFKNIGCRIPKGILMVGLPGTGKTLLAKALAGESNVPFFNISGSDFVEMFVGVGASRVRNMFYEAKKNSPCIIFIDEIDAVGRQRGFGLGSGNDEREQTLNQILVEMDGFNTKDNIVVIAATNRLDILDPALLRSGRFDRQILIDLPDIKGREEILRIHTKKIFMDLNINLSLISKYTSGFSGADLFNLVNESVILAIKNNKNHVSMDDFEKSIDKILLGLEKSSMVITNDQKELTAYHESGHTIVGKLISNNDLLHKVTIIPRSKSLGATCFLQEENLLNFNKIKLENQISILYGGRIAEEIIYGKNFVSTGSKDDIKKATIIARNMIMKWGYSYKLGPLYYDNIDLSNKKLFNNNKNISEYTHKIIDEEILNLIKINYNKAKNILINNINILHNMKDALIEYETLDSIQINKIINKKL
ncbi:ATP-dependent zinc metalloprotease FtsH [endosymbiont of Pachyrhynchus infernalis]|uniref:ATP-dependent zinc metalloprotease FtsH n=1 Tax=endosymbiont of Pachyrhynchus infernalis TaxID=1971488 RepID=UPI000DC6DC03|nr:ATP-dependent zinc metalloprotease FtsH [endosymbiont of Pachyrhynchus infernalis]BBA84951.1 ATP-dependent zinc metalloprotease FtsH [endosymbiont of Pachyrhynchus infernalis]